MSAITFRNYTSEAGFGADFLRVHDFLVRINEPEVTTANFLWGRWEWMFSLPYLERKSLDRIGLWEDQGRIVGLATYESEPGSVYFYSDPVYACLKPEMLDYARANLHKDGHIQVLINDNDRALQRAALARGFKPAQEHEPVSLIDIDDHLAWSLPDGFSVQSLADGFDLRKLNRCMWRGFNHAGDAPEDAQALLEREISLSGPHVNLDLNMVVVAPTGYYASYCGMWHLPGSDYALVEPVCTDPAWRRMGCGKAAVLAAVHRCGEHGARSAYVGSSQDFYYALGFYPIGTERWWRAC